MNKTTDYLNYVPSTGVLSVQTLRATTVSATTVSATNFSIIPAGTLMLFQQTTAPTGWTKQTAHNDKALRVVSGSAGSGGTYTFSSMFASRTPSGGVTGTVTMTNGAVTLTIAQMPSHTHSFSQYNTANGLAAGSGRAGALTGTPSTNATGGGGSHTHVNTATWSGSFSGNAMDFSVAYVDLIIASKN